MAGDARQRFIEDLLRLETPALEALTRRERALVRYADVLTLRPASVTRAEVDALRAEGLDDLAIHDACSIVSYLNPAPSPEAQGNTVLLYDGECGFCSRTVRFMLEHERRHTLRFASLESSFAEKVFTRHPELRGLETLIWLDESRGEILTESSASLRALCYLGGPWRLMAVLGLVPRSLRDRVYGFVSRHRHALTRDVKECYRPPPEARHRFLDETPA